MRLYFYASVFALHLLQFADCDTLSPYFISIFPRLRPAVCISSHRRLFLRHLFHTAVICCKRRLSRTSVRHNTRSRSSALFGSSTPLWTCASTWPVLSRCDFAAVEILRKKQKSHGNWMSHSLKQQPQNNTRCSVDLRVFKTRGRSVIATLTHQHNTTDRHVGRNNNRKVHRLAKTFSTITIRCSCRDTLTTIFIWYFSPKGRRSQLKAEHSVPFHPLLRSLQLCVCKSQWAGGWNICINRMLQWTQFNHSDITTFPTVSLMMCVTSHLEFENKNLKWK